MKHTEETAKPNLTVRNRHPTKKINCAALRSIILSVLKEAPFTIRPEQSSFHEICVVFVGDTKMQQLNQRWLRHAGTTDVIAFDYSAGRATKNTPLHGDIVISIDEAERQARRFRTKWQTEIVRYLLHGLLHLRGFDDLNASQRHKMVTIENKLLEKVGKRFDLLKVVPKDR